MKMWKYSMTVALAVLAASAAHAQGLAITQISTDRLLSSQETRLYQIGRAHV